MEVTRYDRLVLENIQYDKPDNQGNVYFGTMYYDLNPLLIQSSRLVVKEIKQDGKHKYLVVETDSKDFRFYDKLVQIDDYNLDQTYQKSEQWFNKELPMDILEGMYKRITKPFKKDEVPTIEFKIPFSGDKPVTKIYNQTNELIDLDLVKPGSTIILMIHVRGLKFLKQNYYCDVFLSQFKLIKEPIIIKTNTCLIEDDEDDENKQESVEDEKYDYEILDEELMLKNKEIEDLEKLILDKKQIIEKEQEELSSLEEKLSNLK